MDRTLPRRRPTLLLLPVVSRVWIWKQSKEGGMAISVRLENSHTLSHKVDERTDDGNLQAMKTLGVDRSEKKKINEQLLRRKFGLQTHVYSVYTQYCRGW